MGIHDGHRKNLRQSFLVTGFAGKTEHQALELLLTYSIPLNELALLAEGTPDQTTVNIRDAVAHVLHSGAKQVILAHNHPSGITDPSMQDIIMTHNACNAFAPMGVNVIDHMIFAGNEVFSLRANGFMKDLPEDE